MSIFDFRKKKKFITSKLRNASTVRSFTAYGVKRLCFPVKAEKASSLRFGGTLRGVVRRALFAGDAFLCTGV